MAGNIVTAVFGAFKETRTRKLWQWDYGMKLRFVGLDLPAQYTVHEANEPMSGNAKTRLGDETGVDILDEYLTTGKPVYVWLYLHTGSADGETVYMVTIPVQPRPKPVEDPPTPVQQGLVEQALQALDAGVAEAEAAAELLSHPGAEATTLVPGSAATAGYQDGVFSFGIPQGEKGDAGDDGVSPTVTVTDITGGHRVTITDAEGTYAFDVLDGTDGEEGRGIASAVLNADYTLTLTYTDGTSYTTPSIRGPKGDPGEVSEAELTEKLADKADVIVDTASGAIASFPDGAAVPAKDVTIGIEPVQAGSGDPSPTNVRPISGWTGANVVRTGKNLFDTEWEIGSINIVTGENVSSSTAIRSKNYIPVKGGQTVTIGYDVASAGSVYALSIAYHEDKSFSRYIGEFANIKTITLNSDEKYIRFYRYDSTEPLPDCIISYGATATAYEPYTGTTYPISWQSTAGTVYGGTLDVTTGLLTVTMAEVDLGTLTWSATVTDTPGKNRFMADVPGMKIGTSAQVRYICSCYSKIVSTYTYGITGMTTHGTLARVLVADVAKAEMTGDEFKQAVTGQTLVYELAEPVTYQLTATEVALLLGDNNVWADTGDTTVAYRADTKLYIQKINAPTDDDMTADAQIASGKYFIVGGNLYKSTTTIPAGDTITPGTNCILTNLADALNALNT